MKNGLYSSHHTMSIKFIEGKRSLPVEQIITAEKARQNTSQSAYQETVL
jgi:hypothetical protein